VIDRLIANAEMRAMISAMWDQDLADAIRYISQTARRAFLNDVWDGFDSTVIERFLRQHPPTLTT
jgi:hypothetical protein